MDPRKLFTDQRFAGVCAYCGAPADSRDHVPSKVLLDEPYPTNLPIAESCAGCNQGFSSSEEYVACFIECAKKGTTEPNREFRPKIAATLKARPAISQRIEQLKLVSEDGAIVWQAEISRVREVVLKLARGHLAYDLGLQRIDEPMVVEIMLISSISEILLQDFLDLSPSGIYPEIGSRSFVNSLMGKATGYEAWHVVQDENYQYAVGQGAGDWVKIVLGDYIACYVAWD